MIHLVVPSPSFFGFLIFGDFKPSGSFKTSNDLEMGWQFTAGGWWRSPGGAAGAAESAKRALGPRWSRCWAPWVVWGPGEAFCGELADER